MSPPPRSERTYRRRVIVASIITVVLLLATVGPVVFVAWSARQSRIRKLQAAEVNHDLARIVAGARAYFDADHVDARGEPRPRCFPSNTGAALVTHADMSRGCCPGPCPAGEVWDAAGANGAGWRALGFALADPHYYKYRFVGSCCRGDDCSTAAFTARAVGDLDCDGVTALFERTGRVVDGGVEVSPLNDRRPEGVE